MVIAEEKQFEDPAQYAVPSAGVIWGSLSQEIQEDYIMLWTIIVILVILWLLGFFGRNISSRFPRTGNWIHILIVVAIVLIILNLVNVV